MNVNDPSILEKINNLIASERLSKSQILKLVNLASISNSFRELKDNINWETLNPNIK